jgi:predicted transcriptional regulator
MTKVVTLRLDEEKYRELKEAAEAENRAISNLIETAALARVREQQFVDDAEMAEIRTDEQLQKRLRRGSADARNRRGNFVG